MRPRTSGYLSPGRRPRRSVLRSAQLNAVGHAALAGACLGAGLLTAFALQVTGWPLPLRAAVGPVVVLTALVVADRRKWARMETSFSFTDDPAELRGVGARLVARGLPVRIDTDDRGPRLSYRNRDAARVQAALAELGITMP